MSILPSKGVFANPGKNLLFPAFTGLMSGAELANGASVGQVAAENGASAGTFLTAKHFLDKWIPAQTGKMKALKSTLLLVGGTLGSMFGAGAAGSFADKHLPIYRFTKQTNKPIASLGRISTGYGHIPVGLDSPTNQFRNGYNYGFSGYPKSIASNAQGQS